MLPVIEKKGYSDVPAGSTFAADIQWLTDKGITAGYPDGTFRPGNPVDRGVLATFLHRLAGSPAVTAPRTQPFTDVKPGSEGYDAIIWVHQQGIARGYGDGTYRPGKSVTRRESAAFLHRYAGSPAIAKLTKNPFTDVPKGSSLAPEISWLKETGIAAGRPDGSFHPDEALRRDEAAAFLHRATEGAKVTFRPSA
ncbi:S-layer homology domain-containing protein [Brachybacterium sp. AOP25-B2-12]|uniref:S-layer homology domain-containing protein n=1 Tax=Brachybacterium sp. AOP25-B2-12 TaxID=3457710 RepID=UPI0040345D62